VVGRDSSDIDVYVVTVPGSTGPLTEVDSSVAAGSTENIMADLPAGSYYLAVVDYAGVAERYSMCVREITLLAVRTCNLILPGPPSQTPRRSKPRPLLSNTLSGASGMPHSLFGSFRRP